MKKTLTTSTETRNNETSKRVNRTNWFSTSTQALYWIGSPWAAFGTWFREAR
ncbi:MAG: hypothetical protein RR949_08005 [Oscillospiraceae bacterium]